uniref:Protein kinase domain-containing protein n=1 Tax=Oryzias melastigma TaxID=30732 RepID=A0A3B3BWI9_ORYME
MQLLLEFCKTFAGFLKGNNIFNRKAPKQFTVSELRPVAQQLVVALRALKTMGIVHCDIKLNNIMFIDHNAAPYKIKLIDFGLAREKSSLGCLSDIQILGYRAPEVVFACLYDYIASIVHMQGMKVYEFFNISSNKKVFTLDDMLNIRFGEKDTDKPEDESDLEEFKSLIKQMLNVNPRKRITPEEALNHNFITMSHLSSITDDSYVTEAQQLMEVCEPAPIQQPLAHRCFLKRINKTPPVFTSAQNYCDKRSTCGHNEKKRLTSTVKDISTAPIIFKNSTVVPIPKTPTASCLKTGP